MLFLEEGKFSIFFYMIITNYVIKRGSIGWRFLEWFLIWLWFKDETSCCFHEIHTKAYYNSSLSVKADDLSQNDKKVYYFC